jgi:arylsulfatase
VLPLDDRFIERADPRLRPSLIAGRTDFIYYPGATRLPESSSPNVKNRSHSITVHVDVPQSGGDGVLVAAGGVVGGYALYVKDGKPTYEYNWFSQERYKVQGIDELPTGPATIRMDFKYDGGGLAKGVWLPSSSTTKRSQRVGSTKRSLAATRPTRHSMSAGTPDHR